MIKFDLIEKDPKYRDIFKKIDKEVEESIKDSPIYKTKPDGYALFFWNKKKALLRTKYGIDWKTPSELNPDVSFD